MMIKFLRQNYRCLVVTGFVGLSLYVGYSVLTYGSRRIPVEQIHAWSHEATGIMLISRLGESKESQAHITLMRGSESHALHLDKGESWGSIFVASGANAAFALIKKYGSLESYELPRLVMITLPVLGNALDTATIETLFWEYDPQVYEERSWIDDILGATEDGSRLLLVRAIPYSAQDSGIGWLYRYVVYDVEAREFTDMEFESDKPHLYADKTGGD